MLYTDRDVFLKFLSVFGNPKKNFLCVRVSFDCIYAVYNMGNFSTGKHRVNEVVGSPGFSI